MTDSVVVEGYARLRDGKKWKTRWLVLRKPSPVADCLVLLVFKDKSDKAQGHKEKASVTLEEICGLEAGQWYEGVAFTLVILCLNQAALLGFDSREALQAWDARLRYSLGEVHRFSVGVLPGTKLESGPATLHLCNNLLALARDVPPVIIGHWNLPDLRRYGPVPNGFVFEGGTRCGYWAGVFLLASAESEQISFLFDCIVRGISPTRGPFGLRPVLPDPSASQTNVEEKLNHETQELEKRLSMLSHRSSTASSTYCPSAGGDDRSISGSSDTSDTSQSDCSIGSRLAIWTEPASALSENVHHAAAKVAPPSAEKLSVSPGAGSRPATKPPRQLQEIGRQSSSDSGIATGSHSSYSGSFSSYTGSLDITSGEDFGSVFSLPPHLAQDLSPCTCPSVPGHEYLVPTSLRYLYDTPRSLLQDGNVGGEPSTPTKDPSALSGLTTESAKGDKDSITSCEGPSDTTDRRSITEQGPSEESRNNKALPSSEHPDSCHICSSVTSVPKTIVAICSVCGGFKWTPCIPSSGSTPAAIPADQSVDKSPCRPGTATEYCVTVKKVLERSWASSGSGRVHEMREDSPLPKKGREKLSSLLADLLGFPSADKQPDETKASGLSLYESMSSAFGNELKSTPTGTGAPLQDSQQDARAAIYENCLKCQREHCHPPARVAPAQMHRNRSDPTFHSLPSGLRLRKSHEHEVAVNEALLHRGHGDGSQSADGLCRSEEMNGRPLVTMEDKRLNSKEERRRADPAYAIMENRAPERNSEAEEKSKYELMGSCGPQRFLPETEGAVFVFPPERPCSDGVTYVNIPVSPASKKQLNYMELELQEPGPGPRGTLAHLPAQGKSSTKYAQIDITATETAHKVGTQHALGRQEGLLTLELRRKATPH
ncbi:protein Dok-7-like isoform X1 [Scophthalmus maximus]|uniref:protein Dok-7-like isoform X1 n=1 Tax=Scophthalmus maximus TaxID=52904 RepID=UPI001FA93A7F|nr:protein Dok-7-like isoform X1 [Scophthalmus maximus]XP_047191914.1 protein Dok-7-like isoform X1 [Scophthalmus maximus]